MTERLENEGTHDRWLAPLITATAAMACLGVGWTSLLLLHFPSILAMVGLVLAGVIAYRVFTAFEWLSYRHPFWAAAGALAMIAAVVILWPVTCATKGGELGAPIHHYCTCNGLTVVSYQQNVSHPTITTYCLGLETADVWEERKVFETIN